MQHISDDSRLSESLSDDGQFLMRVSSTKFLLRGVQNFSAQSPRRRFVMMSFSESLSALKFGPGIFVLIERNIIPRITIKYFELIYLTQRLC